MCEWAAGGRLERPDAEVGVVWRGGTHVSEVVWEA